MLAIVADNFADAVTIDGDVGSVLGHNLGTTFESASGELYSWDSVWYTWTAPVTWNATLGMRFTTEDNATAVHLTMYMFTAPTLPATMGNINTFTGILVRPRLHATMGCSLMRPEHWPHLAVRRPAHYHR